MYLMNLKRNTIMSNQNKPVVMYDSNKENYCFGVGCRAYLVPINHPNKRLNSRFCTTSMVTRVNEDTIETKNTIYKPYKQENVENLNIQK